MKKTIHFHDGGQHFGRDNPTPPFGRRHLTLLFAAVGVAVLLMTPLAHAAGTVTAWGYNNYGQTNVPLGLSNVVAVAAGGCDSLALRADGTVVAWGDNDQTTVPAGLSNVVAVAAGGRWDGGGHTLALRADGTIAAWGNNDDGEATVPAGLTDVVAVAAGESHSLAVRADGTVAAWGGNGSGQTNVPAGLGNVVAVAAGGSHSLALRADGTVAAWGDNSGGQTNVPSGLSNVVAVAAGADHSLALRANGTMAAWGDNGDGEATVPAGLTNVAAVAAGEWFSLALRTNGTVAAWGLNDRRQTNVPSGLTNAVAVAAGGSHSLALSGSLAPFLTRPLISQTVVAGATATFGMSVTASRPYFYQWQMNGTNLPAATNAFLVLTNVTLSQAGSYSVVVSNSVGTATSSNALLSVVPLIIITQPQSQSVCVGCTASFGVNCQSVLPLTYQWRMNGTNLPGATNNPLVLTNVNYSQAGSYSVVVSNSAGAVTSSNALLSVVPVAAWGANWYGQTTVPAGLSNVVAVAAGASHSLALRADGTVAAWGDNSAGQTTVPVGLSNVVAVAAGGYHSLALRTDGTVAAWGYNGSGQTTVPVGLSNVVAVAAGGSHSLALRADGTVAAWGDNWAGQATVPVGLSNAVAVAGGFFHSLALRTDGTVAAWGLNGDGQTTVPAGLSNVVAVAGGGFHSLALRANGTVAAWGNNSYGQTSVPAGLSNVVAVAGGGNHSLALSGGLAPFLNRPIFAQTVIVGATATFRVNVTASQPWFFQWQMNGTNLPGATNALLVLTNMLLNQAGSYTIIVSNSFGTVTNTALLTVVPLVINTQPQSQTVFAGCTASFGVSCQSTLPLTYQWRHHDTNLPGATSNPLVLTNIALSQAGSYTVVVSNSAGSVVSAKAVLTVVLVAAWGNNGNGETNVPSGLTNVVAVAGGGWHSLALRADGTVVAWGYNGDGEATVPVGLSNVVSVAGGWDDSLALRADGTVVAWGWNYYGQTNVPAGLSNVVAVADGGEHSLALRADGTVAAWGADWSGQTNVPFLLHNVVAVAAGGSHNLALRADGTVTAWGDNGSGQTNVPVGLSNVVAVAAGDSHCLALRADGTLAAWGDNSYGQTDVPSLGAIGGIACGAYHSLVVAATGHPFITSRLASRVGLPGGTVFFRVEANGARPLRYQWQCNGIDLPGSTNAVLQLTGLTTNNSDNYSVIVSNVLGVATIPAANLLVTFDPLQIALNNTLTWSLGGDAAWFAETTETHDGVEAAQSGPITDNQESWLETSVVGTGTLTYWWKVSSEQDYDFLEFYLDGVLQASISGEVDWQKQTYSIPAGTHTIGWDYVKDVYDSFGQDAGWLDEVNFATTMIPFQFTGGGSLSVSNGTFNMRLTGSPGANVVVESSFNLTTWTPWQTNMLPDGGLDLAIPMGTNQLQFFRARIP